MKPLSLVGTGLWLLPLLVLLRPADADANGGRHIIMEVHGKVELKRAGWAQGTYVRADYSMPVEKGDLLNLEPGASVTVACGDGTRVTVKETGAVPCSTEGTRPAEGRLHSSRGNTDPRVPIILSPRATKLLAPRPRLRWAPVSGTSKYLLTIEEVGSPQKHWSMTVEGKTEILYPKNAPALVPGRPYLFRVEANGHLSDEEKVPDLKFSVLERAAAEPIQKVASRMRALGQPADKTRFLIASLYAHQGLFAEAIAELEGQPEASREAAVAYLLGSSYRRINLPSQALPHMLKALELSRRIGEREREMEAEEELGLLYGALGDPDEQNRRLRNALKLYRTVEPAGSKKLEELQRQLN